MKGLNWIKRWRRKSEPQAEQEKTVSPSKRRLLGLRNKDTHQGIDNIEIDPQAQQEVFEDTDSAAEHLVAKVGKDPIAIAAIATLAGVGLTRSKPAHASIAQAVAKAIQEILKPLMKNAVGSITDQIFDSNTESSDKVVGAVGASGNAIQEMIKKNHDAQVVQDSRPAPDACVTDGASQSAVYGRIYAAHVRGQQSQYTAREFMQGGKRQLKVLTAEMANRGKDFPNDEDLNAANLIADTGYTDEQEKVAQAFLRRIRGDMAINNLTLTEGQKQSTRGKLYQLHKASVGARANVALTAFHDITGRRYKSHDMAKALKSAVEAENDETQWEKQRLKELTKEQDGLSLLDVMTFEVDRRYANEDWRNLMASPPSSVPLLREIANMLAFQNFMLLQQYNQEELSLSIQASQLTSETANAAQALTAKYIET